ncbi:MAG: sigma 54-interacting transcriptional regulator [Myxococcota bacterium]
MKRQTIATTYGFELARMVERVDQAADCHLVVVEGPSMGAHARLGTTPVVVGADPGCDLVLADERASARHAEVVRQGLGFRVKDLGSTNGILFQGALVRELELGVGGTFTLGRTPLRVQPSARPTDLPPSPATRFGELVGQSLAMRELFAVLELAALSDVTLLVEGETGTGKELVARAVHDQGARRRGPFVALDCGALPDGLIESALFGHVKGAFTGAERARDGAFVQAHGGTLFLDEIGNLPLAAQARLLRALEARVVRAVGGDGERAVDVRVVAATASDLEAAVKAGRFRADLFYRLAVVQVRIPPLRERMEDVPLIAAELLRRRGFAAGELAGPGLDLLRSHAWPGNVRELRNVLERALALSPGAERFADLRIAAPGQSAGGLDVRTELPWAAAKDRVVLAFERAYLADLARRFPDNLSAMARAADLDRKTLRALLDKHGLR